VLLQDCDAVVRKLAKELGWEEELNVLWAQTESSVDEKFREQPKNDVEAEDSNEPDNRDEKLQSQIDQITNDIETSLKVTDDNNAVEPSTTEKNVESPDPPTARDEANLADDDTEGPS